MDDAPRVHVGRVSEDVTEEELRASAHVACSHVAVCNRAECADCKQEDCCGTNPRKEVCLSFQTGGASGCGGGMADLNRFILQKKTVPKKRQECVQRGGLPVRSKSRSGDALPVTTRRAPMCPHCFVWSNNGSTTLLRTSRRIRPVPTIHLDTFCVCWSPGRLRWPPRAPPKSPRRALPVASRRVAGRA